MNKKAVFFDVDGTLIDYSAGMQNVLPSTRDAIEIVKKKGHLAILATGRPKSFLSDEILQLNFDGFIMSNGAYIQFGDEVVYNREIDKSAIKDIVEFLRTRNMDFIFEGQQYAYFSTFESPEIKALFDSFSVPTKYVIDKWNIEDVSANKMVILARDEVQLRNSIEKLGDRFKFMNHPGLISYDVYFKDCTKADGITKLVKHLGLNMENTYAFGDGINDIEMLQVVKWGIAMGNANERLKRVADLVTKDVFSDGIYSALKELKVI